MSTRCLQCQHVIEAEGCFYRISLELWEDCANGTRQQILDAGVILVCGSCAREFTVEDVVGQALARHGSADTGGGA